MTERMVSGSGQWDPGGGKRGIRLVPSQRTRYAIAKVPNTLSPGALSDGAAGVLVENVAARAHHAAASSLSIWLSHSSERFSLNVTSPLRLRTERRAAASSCSRTGSSR
jgi:hypothetical protein